MADKITSLDEITDPEGFLRSYYHALEDAKTLRQTNKELQEQITANEEASAGSQEEISKWKDRVIRSTALSELKAQGIKNPERILKYVDLKDIDLGDDDKLTGFDEKLTVVKEDFPELFDVKRRAARQSVDIHADSPAQTKLTGTDAQVARIFGGK